MSKTIFFEKLLQNNKFSALAIDQGTSLKNIIKEKKQNMFQEQDYYTFKKEIITKLGTKLSSVLFDYDTYANDPFYLKLDIPKIIAYEDDAYHIDNKERITLLPKKLNKNSKPLNDFSAIKFFMYYNPDSQKETNDKKNILIKQIGMMCKDLDTPFLFEPLLYYDQSTNISEEEYFAKKPIYIEHFYNEFSKPSYQVDIIKIEFPFNEFEVKGFENDLTQIRYNQKNCEDILQTCFQNSSVPFVFLSAGMKFNNFLSSLELAKTSNINTLGFLCGRSLWQDSIDIFSTKNIESFLNWLDTEGLNRVKKLKKTLIND